MSRTQKRNLIRTIALAAAAAAIAVAAGVASADSSPAAHHALADGGVISTN
jgi:hypothetical protein